MRISQMMHFPLMGAGTGIYVDTLTTALIKGGDDVHVLCSHHELPKKNYPVDAVLFNNGKNSKYDVNFDFPVFASHPLSKGKQFGELNKQERKEFTEAFRKKIDKIINEFKPDLIHVHHGWIIASIVSEYNIPYMITLHGTEYYAFDNFQEYREEALKGLKGAKIIMALTKKEKDAALEAYALQDKDIEIVKSGTDTDVFIPVELDKSKLLKKYKIPVSERPVVFFGGRMTPQKGIDTLIRAAKIYNKSDINPITILAGDGSLREAHEELAKKLDIKDIYFIGNQTHRQMVDLFNLGDIAVLPSNFEPFGLVAVEALACGTPVIAGNIGGFKTIVNERVGDKIEPGDHKELAKKIIHFLENDFKTNNKQQILDYVRKNYSWKNTVKNIRDIYVDVYNKYNCSTEK